MPLAIAYSPATALNTRRDTAVPAIRAVAAQVRRQLQPGADGLAVQLPALLAASH